jgi:hypothetical protein
MTRKIMFYYYLLIRYRRKRQHASRESAVRISEEKETGATSFTQLL